MVLKEVVKMKLVNLTPHPVVLVVEGGTVEIPPSGYTARAKETRELAGILEDKNLSIPLYRIRYGEPEGIPEIEPDAFYIVSSLAAQSVKTHFPPDIAERFVVVTDPVRDENGRIVGARALTLV
jgi:hypothetical protein